MSNSKGFTLLEVMIAMAIMLVAFSSILMVESQSLTTSMKAKQMNVVGMLAKNSMIEAELAFTGRTFEEVKTEEQGQFKEPYQDYTWIRRVKEVEFPELPLAKPERAEAGRAASAEERANQPQDGSVDMIARLVKKFLSGAIREIEVEVQWKRGTHTQSFVVSQYWVNLNHEFSLSE
jgi:prepilin-type N-terminal cleavage/methylation domain-containing protein